MATDEETAQQRFLAVVEERRRELGMTQDAFARAIGVTAALIRLWRAGKRRVPRERVVRSAEVLKLKPEALWPGWEDAPPAPSRGSRMSPTDAERLAALESEVALHRAALERAGLLAVSGEVTSAPLSPGDDERRRRMRDLASAVDEAAVARDRAK